MVGEWECGRGHEFTYGDEDWHFESMQGLCQDGAPIPTMCTWDDRDGEPCLDSTYLVRLDADV